MKFDLHPHQDRAMDMLRGSLQAGKRRPMLQSPTGSGKTITGAAIVEGALRKGNPVLFTVPFLSLVDQTVDRFAEQGIHTVGVMQGYHPQTDGSQPVQVASVQTLRRRPIPKASIVLIDEAHRWFDFYGEWMAQPEWERVPFVGLSATPWTKGLGKYYDDLLIPTTAKDMISTINPITGRTYLSPYRVFAPSHPDLSKVRTVAGDYHEGDLSGTMSQPVLVADTVSTWLRLGEDRPTLCFAVDRAHARKLANEFEAAGVPTAYVDKDTPIDERRQIGERLANGQVKVVCNIYALTTGVDWDVRCIILARPTKSEILFCQIIGRGLRSVDGKADCLILDHSDTTLRLGFADDIHHTSLDMGKVQRNGGQSKDKSTPLPKECSACSYLKPAGIHKCPQCGFAPERQSLIEDKGGELVQLTGKKKSKGDATSHTKQEVYSMLLWVQKDRDYSPKYAKAKFFDRYAEWPRNLSERAMAPDASFLNWLRSQNIRYAKGQAKREARSAA